MILYLNLIFLFEATAITEGPGLIVFVWWMLLICRKGSMILSVMLAHEKNTI